MTAENPPAMRTFGDPGELATHLAGYAAKRLADGVARRGSASLVVSGGSTPAPFFRALSTLRLPWEKVWITLADERWVDPADPASNEHLVRTNLLRGAAKQAFFVPLKNSAPTAAEGEEACRQALARIPRPFDLVILGMGTDGHTASLIPGAAGLEQALSPQSTRICAPIKPAGNGIERMTLTLPALLDAREIIVHITGRDKRETLNEALKSGSPDRMPIRHVLRRTTVPLQIYWAP
ncbi:MAG: 6-phosphogluconolactonase [Desulfobulbaceae bacterium]